VLKKYEHFLRGIDGDSLIKNIEELSAIEFQQTFPAYKKAAHYVHDAIVRAGIPNAEMIMFPADGKTVYQDKRMPIAWDASVGKLTLLTPEKEIVADFQKHPFHLIKGSVLTPPGGKIVRIITESQFLAGEDPCNTLVMLNQFTRPRATVLKPLLDQGVIGVVADCLEGEERYKTPDSLYWNNASTESGAWYVQSTDRPFIGFAVSPRAGDRIRSLASSGILMAHAESDGKRYEDELPLVTAMVPGEKKEEFWVIAHMYEPLLDDDSNGVMAAIEIAKQIMKQGTPEFSMRIIFALEFYGFAAYAASRGNCLSKEVIGGCNVDALRSLKGQGYRCVPAGSSVPFYGNHIMEILAGKMLSASLVDKIEIQKPAYFDDMFMGEPTVGIPTLWVTKTKGFHHNSIQAKKGWLDKNTLTESIALCATLTDAILNPKEEYVDESAHLAITHLAAIVESIKKDPIGSQAEHFRHAMDIESAHIASYRRCIRKEKVEKALDAVKKKYDTLSASLTHKIPESKWRNYAEKIVADRLETGFPYDLTKFAADEKPRLPDGMLYGAFSNIISNMDGHKDLARLIREAEYETLSVKSEKDIKKYVDAVNSLSDHGYLKTIKRPEIKQKEIEEKLRSLGVEDGSILLVHSSVSNCGYIRGGASTVIDAIMETVGNSGTALFPTFTRPFIYIGSNLNKSYAYRPYDSSDANLISTGNVPKTLLKNYPQAVRSRHVTHSWAGLGKLAKQCTAGHEPDASPAGIESPMGKALEHGGKILFLGTGLAPTTFLHFIENYCDVPFLAPAVCRLKEPSGKLSTVLIQRHLPGHRDFYGNDAIHCKFYVKAVESGLEIKSVSLGVGELNLIDIKQLFKIGVKLVRENPRILLCDEPTCPFCTKY
jgi:aminoglycoside 3-N-acetyltransferase